MARKSAAEAAQTRRLLIESATGLFLARGVRDATLEDVARRAGLTRGAIYWHFAGKADLVEAVIADMNWPLDIGEDLGNYLASLQPLKRLCMQLCAQMLACKHDAHRWPPVFLVLRDGGHATWPQSAVRRVLALQDKAISNIARVMVRARDLHQLRPDLAPEIAARCLHVVAAGILLDHAKIAPMGTVVDMHQCLTVYFAGIELDTPVAPQEGV